MSSRFLLVSPWILDSVLLDDLIQLISFTCGIPYISFSRAVLCCTEAGKEQIIRRKHAKQSAFIATEALWPACRLFQRCSRQKTVQASTWGTRGWPCRWAARFRLGWSKWPRGRKDPLAAILRPTPSSAGQRVRPRSWMCRHILKSHNFNVLQSMSVGWRWFRAACDSIESI